MSHHHKDLSSRYEMLQNNYKNLRSERNTLIALLANDNDVFVKQDTLVINVDGNRCEIQLTKDDIKEIHERYI